MLTLLPASAREIILGEPETLSLKNQDALIEYINKVQSSWTAGKNFPDDTPESYLRRLASFRVPEDDLPRLPVWEESEDEGGVTYPRGDPPAEFDARTKWSKCASISHIYDQGNCGSCWAVSTASVITDRICITTDGAFQGTISAWNIASCCTDEVKCGAGCEGGLPAKAFQHYVKNGLVTGGEFGTNQGCMPYEAKHCSHRMGKDGKFPDCHSYNETVVPKCVTACPNKGYKIAFAKDKHFGKRAYNVKAADLKKELSTYGPVVMAFEVFEDFYLYKTGIYHHTTGKSVGWHAVRIVGYGNGYWLATNSWNPEWGDHGTFKIKSFVDECSCESKYGFDTAEPK
ncbi:unnamed protein product [Bemisia tabaci]|uniref:Peptidase C1A papain C-terminal domain-containing protein n=1 Tax=Bemisia tabaci TaxID=7038 RepID=A0A9P0AE76_BEMTA|nr:unnamed protein product [Bemisia tabaci]